MLSNVCPGDEWADAPQHCVRPTIFGTPTTFEPEPNSGAASPALFMMHADDDDDDTSSSACPPDLTLDYDDELPMESACSSAGSNASPPRLQLFAACGVADDATPRTAADAASPKLPCVAGVIHVGSLADTRDAAAVRRAGIRAFVCVADNVGAAPFPEGVDAARTLHIAVPDKAATQLADHLPELFAFVDAATAAGEHVVVYCRQGISRSVSFVVALVMRALGLPHDAALEHVRRVYPKAEPNFAFVEQLREFEAIIAGM